MSTPARYIVTHIISVGISVCIFPMKLLFDTCFGIFGALGSILIEIIAIFTGDALEQMSAERQLIIQSDQSKIHKRRRHHSAEESQYLNRKPIGSKLSAPSYLNYTKSNMIRNTSDPCFHTSQPPLLKRSDSLRSPTRFRALTIKKRHLCPIHENNSSMQKANSVPLTKPKSSAFSFTNLFQSCANIFVDFERNGGSEFTLDDSIALVNEVKNKCTCRSLASGETSPVSTSSMEDRSGRKIRVKVNAALKDRREMAELEKQMAKLERRRHKSGELREMRRKEQEKQQSLEIEQQGIRVDRMVSYGEKIQESSLGHEIIEDSSISIIPEKSYAG